MPPVRVLALAVGLLALGALAPSRPRMLAASRAAATTATPIQHLVVIFNENVSFDHYFATYPYAANPPGEPAFTPAPGTPAVNGLGSALLYRNPNAAPPFRLDRAQALTCDQDHSYTDEQRAMDGGLMDRFIEFTEGKPSNGNQYCPRDASGAYDAVMGYYDGNTVTALWNYAQTFAMSDNSFSTHFGPSTPGALALVSGDTDRVQCGPATAVFGDQPTCGATTDPMPAANTAPAPSNGNLGAMYSDTQPFYDICSAHTPSSLSVVSGRNIGDLLNAGGVNWGWFQGGFALAADGSCASKHIPEAADGAAGRDSASDANAFGDYVPHHSPFQYYSSTANPLHLPPSSVAAIGMNDQANHEYDLADFFAAIEAGNLPAVAFIKAPAFQDGHAGYSDPLDEQVFLVNTINRLERLPDWSSTAVIIAYDDSDGWYDHVMPPIVNTSNTRLDYGCGDVSMGAPGRCGYGPRQPLLVISPFARRNYVSHALSDQSSILRFIEDNWLGGQRISDSSFDNIAGPLDDLFDFNQHDVRMLLLDPTTGEPIAR